MTIRPFLAIPAAAVLARLPLWPAAHTPSAAGGLLREGMYLASRQLDTGIPSTGRLAITERGYELRARFRPTPHGVFAGVALADVVNEPARLRLSDQHRARSIPSGTWLSAVCELILFGPDDDTSPWSLTLTSANTAVRRGGRWECEQQAGAGSSLNLATVRATEVTDLLMAVSRNGTTTGKLLAEVTARWPQAPEKIIVATIAQLVHLGFLHTDLLPADVGSDPVGHILARIPATHRLRAPLADIRRRLAEADAHQPGTEERWEALISAREVADQVRLVERPLTVDVAVDASLAVPASLVRRAATAAGVLWTVADRKGPTEEYDRRFLDRYGPHRFVPLLEAADPVIGLGADVAQPEKSPTATARIAALNELIIRAVVQEQIEVALDQQTIAALTDPEMAGRPPRTAEVYVRLIADSPHDLREGRLRVAVSTGGSQNAGSTLTRFASLLGHSHTEPDAGGALIVELIVRPRTAAGQTLTAPAGYTKYRIPVESPPTSENDLPLDDLLLVSDGTRTIVWSASLNRQVIPALFSRLTGRLLPPLARLLQLLGHSGTRPWQTWSWGAAGDGPFQPRLRYQDIILTPARWTIPSSLITAADDETAWNAELNQWLANAVPGIPQIVVTEDADRCLPLDLRRTTDRALLRRYVRRGLTAVTEPPGGEDAVQGVVAGPLGSHLLELVIPLARRTEPPAPRHRAPLPPRTFGDGLYLPGDRWLSLAITTPARCQDELLSDLATVVDGLQDHWDSWFWLRYHSPEHGPHLRVRFRGDPTELGGRVLPAISTWVSTMTRRRLAGTMIVEPYDQEIERYGGNHSIRHAEDVFAADSRLALHLLAGEPDQRLKAAALTAAAIARTIAPGDISILTGRHVDRATRQRMAHLRPHVRAADTQPPNLGAGTMNLWAELLDALAVYRDSVPSALRAACGSSIIHMHANRVLTAGTDEPLMRALAADLLARPA